VLLSHPGRIFSRDELIKLAFPDDFDGFDRTIDSHIKNLRSKLEDDSRNPAYIHTVHGMGYKFET
ncbi:MAG: helix-turn-helix domain-containing protein, partial [Spirochaetota bacterium]